VIYSLNELLDTVNLQRRYLTRTDNRDIWNLRLDGVSSQ
jgi:hypothetical protein